MVNDSSDSEEEKKKFKEALDLNFFSDNLYDKGSKDDIVSLETEKIPSVRSQLNQKKVSINPFSIKVTPEFQIYVAKHLSKFLDESIKVLNKKTQGNKKFKKINGSSGIKLLKESKHYLKPFDKKEFYRSKTLLNSLNSNFKNHVSTHELEERAKEVAVSPEWVLSQEETKHWAENRKGEVEYLKLK